MFESLKKAIKKFIDKVVYKELTEKNLRNVLFEFELDLIESDIAVDVAREITKNISSRLAGQIVKRFSDIREIIRLAIREELRSILNIPRVDLVELALKRKEENLNNKYGRWKPFTVVFLGPNGCGKTTSIAKLAYKMKKNSLTVVLACSDTFRAGAIEQLYKHSQKLKVYMIKRQYGADPASVGFDAIEHASSRKKDVVLIDTAGRLGTDMDLIGEMKKIVRVAKPDIKCLVVDALMGNDLVVQARTFSSEVGVDCSILTKVDADVKGGAAITLCYVTKKPISYVGIGQGYEDLVAFDPDWFINKVLS